MKHIQSFQNKLLRSITKAPQGCQKLKATIIIYKIELSNASTLYIFDIVLKRYKDQHWRKLQSLQAFVMFIIVSSSSMWIFLLYFV